ncbi:MAG: LTA synthase family protein [Polyangiaceae bacterium]|nr:LTA synthase family protein [Polyangiaceae bacterium]
MGPRFAEGVGLVVLLGAPLAARAARMRPRAASVWAAVAPVGLVVVGALAATARYAGLTASPVSSLVIPLSTACVLAIPTALTPGRARFVVALVTVLALSLLCVADAVYTWTYGAVLPPSALSVAGQVPSVMGGVLSSLPAHALWALAPPLAAALALALAPPAPVGRVAFVTIAALLGLGGAPAIRGLAAFARAAPVDSGVALRPPMERGFLTTHARDLALLLTRRTGSRDAALVAARALRTARGAPERHPWAGLAHGKSALLLQVESLNAWAIDATIDGEPVMPTLASLCSRGLCFDQVLDQTDAGRSSDGDHLVMTSLHPLPREAVAVSFPDPVVPAMPRTLARAGYTTWSSIADHPTFWNAGRRHRAYGIEESVFRPAIGDGALLGFGLADGVFFERVAPRVARLPRPFFAWLITLSLHAPYAPVPEALGGWRAGSLHGSTLGSYLEVARYVDGAVGRLLQDLEARGALRDTVIVVYGDHGEAAGLELERLTEAGIARGDLPSRVPLIIAGAGVTGRSSRPAGQIDIAPTLLTLLGIEVPRGFVGRALDLGGDGVAVRTDGHAFDARRAWLKDRCVERGTGEALDAGDCASLVRARDLELAASSAIVRHQLTDW